MTAFSDAFNSLLRELNLNTRQVAIQLGNTLPADVAALAAGTRRANFADVRRISHLVVPKDKPEWRAALFRSYLSDEYGEEWLRALDYPSNEHTGASCVASTC